MRLENLDIVANSIDVSCDRDVPNKIKLIPLGTVLSQKGKFIIDKQDFLALKAQFKNRQLDLVIDYEHQTLTNNEAPAAGWIKGLELLTDGVYGCVEWTPRALKMLKDKEYRYLSPVVLLDKNKHVRALHSVALTNTPAIDGMTPIVNSINGVGQMEIEKIIKLLGFNEDSTEEEILDKLKELMAQADKADGEMIKNKYVDPEIVALKNEIYQKDMQLKQVEIETEILNAMKQGKIIPTQKELALKMAYNDLEFFKDWVANSPVIVPMGELDTSSSDRDTYNEPRLNRLLGITKEDVKRYNK